MKTLVAGWFSFPEMGATAGDLLTRDLVCRWLDSAAQPYDIALAQPFPGGVDWHVVDPGLYSNVVFVCGPFGNGWPIPDFLLRFTGKRMIGINLSMLQPLDAWNPFELLLERDSSRTARPDLSLLAPRAAVPVVGIILVHEQAEYKAGLHRTAHEAIARLVASRPMSAVNIDTRLDVNATGLRTAAEVESLIARMDVVVTTRLHGLVLAIRNGIPAVVIDPVDGGAKVTRQAATLGWPALTAEALSDQALSQAFEWTLSDAARLAARECRSRALGQLRDIRTQFLSMFLTEEAETY